jgi:hypothetical protein
MVADRPNNVLVPLSLDGKIPALSPFVFLAPFQFYKIGTTSASIARPAASADIHFFKDHNRQKWLLPPKREEQVLHNAVLIMLKRKC